MLKGTYFPDHADNLMGKEGDVEGAREIFFKNKPNNLAFLLKERYEWMNSYINHNDTVVELGSGAGFAREFISKGNLVLTDVVKRPWIDRAVDAMNPDFSEKSINVLICSHMIHHLASPVNFFRKIHPYLSDNAYILIQEINTSLLMRVLLRVMRHEGWSYDIDIFDSHSICNDPRDPWSANCAIPQMLFVDKQKFEQYIPGFEIIENRLCEGLIFPLSGGVIAKSNTIQLPKFVLTTINLLDKLLIRVAPRIFALGRSVVLRKIPNKRK